MGIKNIKINVSYNKLYVCYYENICGAKAKNYTQGNIVSKKGIKLT